MKQALRRGWRRLMDQVDLMRAVADDARRYARHAIATARTPSRAHLEALLTMDCHRLEKGLAMKSPRPGFGKGVARRLANQLGTYLDRFGRSRLTDMTLRVLDAYGDFQVRHGQEDAALHDQTVALRIRNGALGEPAVTGGTRRVRREDIWRHGRSDLRGFFHSRHSIRQFAPDKVDPSDIEQAVDLAMHSPSVCNRQNWKVYRFDNPDRIARLLAQQNGNRGFGEQVPCLLLLAADLQGFTNATERHEAWFDGGLFAMSLVHALHSLGLGTCCLNQCHGPKQDRAIRKLAQVPENEVLLTMLAVGHLPEELDVACSPRKPLADVLVHRP
jgi:nitroreductase